MTLLHSRAGGGSPLFDPRAVDQPPLAPKRWTLIGTIKPWTMTRCDEIQGCMGQGGCMGQCPRRGVRVGDPVMSVGPPSGGPTFVGPLSGGPSSVPSSRFSSIGSIKPVMPDCVDDNATAPKSGWFLSFGPPTGGPIVVGAPRGRPTTVGPPSGEPTLVTLSQFSSVGPLTSVTM